MLYRDEHPEPDPPRPAALALEDWVLVGFLAVGSFAALVFVILIVLAHEAQ